MKVWVVSVLCDDEYGCTAVDEIFATEEGALAYLEEIDECEDIPRKDVTYTNWADDKEYPVYTVRAWEVK